jgi:hypothetical protein
MDMLDWNVHVQRIIAAHRRDPNAIHTSPFPLTYQVLGGETKNMVPIDLLNYGENYQLNAIGVPPQMQHGDLQTQTAPIAVRLFERHWMSIPRDANRFLRWLVSKLSPKLGWKPVRIRLEIPNVIDNLDQLMLKMQLADKGDLAATTLLKILGYSFEEQKRIQKDEAKLVAKLETEQQEELDQSLGGAHLITQTAMDNAAMQQQAAAGQPAAPQAAPQAAQQAGSPAAAGQAAGAPMPGAPMPGAPMSQQAAQILARVEQFGSPTTPMSPQNMTAMAAEVAAQLIYMPEIEKRSILRQIAAVNATIKDLIVEEMAKQRRQIGTQAYQQAMAQGQPQGQPMQGTPM